jgi:DnaK suppressor protein
MKHQNDTLKAVLQNKRCELVRAIRSQSAYLGIGDAERELVDLIQGMSRRDEAVTFLNSLTRTLADVDAALAGLKEGSHGDCAECGEPIASKRLQAIPWASHCIRCQERLDRRDQTRAAIRYWDEAA